MRKTYKVNHDYVIELHKSGKSKKEISNIVGCTQSNVTYILKKNIYGYKIRKYSRRYGTWTHAFENKQKIIGVYSIVNLINGKMYIGSSENIYQRINSHYTKLNNGTRTNSNLQKDFNYYGEKMFCCNILHISKDILEATNIEYELFNLFDKNILYNKFTNILDVKSLINEKTIARFFEKVNKTNTCWNFNGKISGAGYGQMKSKGITLTAHRLSYEIHKGAVGKNLVGHYCNNKKCVNPEHLYLTNNSENANYYFSSNKHLLQQNYTTSDFQN